MEKTIKENKNFMSKLLDFTQKHLFKISTILYGVLFFYSLLFSNPVGSLVRALLAPNGEPSTGKLVDNIAGKVNNSSGLRENGLYPNIFNFLNKNEFIGRFIFWLGIIGLILGGICLLYRCHIRKKYYLTNKIVTGMYVGYMFLTVIITLILIVPFMSQFLGLPFAEINQNLVKYNYNTINRANVVIYIIGILITCLILVSFVLITLLYLEKLFHIFQKRETKTLEEVTVNE